MTPGLNTKPPRSKLAERGASLILFTFLTVLIVIPMIGLAIDGSIVFWEKARLSASVDAAALAAGRSLSVGQTLTAQVASATATAQNYFTANFQPGSMGTSVVGGQPTITVAQTSTTVRTVTVQATVTVPLYFLRLLGFQNATLPDTGQAQRRDVNVIVVIDRSGSMNQGTECTTMIASAQTFVNMFVDGRDDLGLITFQTTANLDYSPTLTFKSSSPSMTSVLGNLVCSGATNSSMALSMAYQEIKAINRPGALSVILFYTDGYPTAFYIGGSNPYPIKTFSDTRYSATNTSSLVTAPASSRNHSDVLAGIVTLPGQSPTTTGTTYGITNPSGIAISSSAGSNPPVISAPGCSFASSGWDYWRNDAAYIPSQDYYGNLTDTGYQPVDYFPASNTHYSGQIRPDSPESIVDVAFNTADEAAKTARNDTTYNIIIYTIGLGPQVDQDFLERVANDPRGSSYDSTKPAGEFVYAPTSSQLSAAFQQIASEVLRLGQ